MRLPCTGYSEFAILKTWSNLCKQNIIIRKIGIGF